MVPALVTPSFSTTSTVSRSASPSPSPSTSSTWSQSATTSSSESYTSTCRDYDDLSTDDTCEVMRPLPPHAALALLATLAPPQQHGNATDLEVAEAGVYG